MLALSTICRLDRFRMTIIFDDAVKQCGVGVLQIYTDISNITIDVHTVCQNPTTLAAVKRDHFVPPDISIGRA
jgi:hypothetical protein